MPKNNENLKEFTLLTSNVCLLPECWARNYNLPNILERAHKLATCFITGQGQDLNVSR